MKVFPRGAQSIRHRILQSVLLLSLTTGGIFAGIAYFSYEAAVDRLVRWHMEPVMRLLVAADEGNIKGKTGTVVSSEELAKTLKLKLRTGKSIRKAHRPGDTDEAELIRLDRERYVLAYRTKGGLDYAVEGKIKDFADLESTITWLFAGCLAASLVLAALMGLLLGRRVVAPLLELTREVREERPLDTLPLCRREDEIGFLARAFAQRETSLKNFLTREQVFTGDVSHELRTPLTVLSGSLEILESQPQGHMPPALLQSQLERMRRTLTDMTATVNTLLLLARTPQQVRNQSIDLSETSRLAAAKMEEALCLKGIAFMTTIAPGVVAQGHAELAALILNNLLDNACRYTEQGSISLRLSFDRLEVGDTAAPIAEEVRSKMFERGSRGQSKVPGCGLGLSLVQRACEHMGWKVAYNAPPEGGNRFTVHFTRP